MTKIYTVIPSPIEEKIYTAQIHYSLPRFQLNNEYSQKEEHFLQSRDRSVGDF